MSRTCTRSHRKVSQPSSDAAEISLALLHALQRCVILHAVPHDAAQPTVAMAVLCLRQRRIYPQTWITRIAPAPSAGQKRRKHVEQQGKPRGDLRSRMSRARFCCRIAAPSKVAPCSSRSRLWAPLTHPTCQAFDSNRDRHWRAGSRRMAYFVCGTQCINFIPPNATNRRQHSDLLQCM